ncbi:hypothetical protein SNK03_009635 [Fusarium graminearum]
MASICCRFATRELNREYAQEGLFELCLVQMARIMKELQHSPALARGFLLSIVTVSSAGVEALHKSSAPMVVGPRDTPPMRLWTQFQLYMRYPEVHLDKTAGTSGLPIICMSTSRCLRLCTTSNPFSKCLPSAGDPESAVISSKLSADLLIRT